VDDDLRTERFHDPMTGTQQVMPKRNLDERATRIKEIAKYTKLPELVVGRRLGEDELTEFKAKQTVQEATDKAATRAREEAERPRIEYGKVLAGALQIGGNVGEAQRLLADPNTPTPVREIAQKSLDLYKDRLGTNLGKGQLEWEEGYIKQYNSGFADAVKNHESVFLGMDISKLKPGERPPEVIQRITERARADAAFQWKLMGHPEYPVNHADSIMSEADQRTMASIEGFRKETGLGTLKNPVVALAAAAGAGAAALAEPEVKQVGYLKSGRPVVQNPDGSTSTHKNMIAGFGNKFYIVPTMYGGNFYEPDDAADIILRNNLIDPDTGQPLVGYNSQQEAEQAEMAQHGQLEQEPVIPQAGSPAEPYRALRERLTRRSGPQGGDYPDLRRRFGLQ
jgi:hypothetical protein